MPAFDGTGPQGKGPLTGRGMGSCKGGVGRQGGMRRGFGCGRIIRRGLGRFFGGGQTWSKIDLEDYKKALKEEIEDVDKEIEETNKKE